MKYRLMLEVSSMSGWVEPIDLDEVFDDRDEAYDAIADDLSVYDVYLEDYSSDCQPSQVVVVEEQN
mgnify:CR=1 FL=1